MARSFANIMTAIWDDEDFLALTERAQRVYLMLVTQKDISAAGTLSLRVRRWASKAKDTTGATIAEGLKELEQARFIVADKVTEELLVRSFVRWDRGYRNSKRRPVIFRAAEEIDSPTLRRSLREEFARLDLPTDGLSDRASDVHADGVSDATSDADADTAHEVADVIDMAEVRETRNEAQISLLSQVDSLSNTVPDTISASNGVVGCYVSSGYATTPKPKSLPPSAARTDPDDARAIIGEWIDGCRKRPPERVIGQIAKQVKELLDEGIDPADIRAGLAEWAAKAKIHPSALSSFVNGVMNRSSTKPPRPSVGHVAYQNPDESAYYQEL